MSAYIDIAIDIDIDVDDVADVDAKDMQIPVLLLACVNAGMKVPRLFAVLEHAALQSLPCMGSDAKVRLLKSLALAGIPQTEIMAPLVCDIDLMLRGLTLPQLADAAYSLALLCRAGTPAAGPVAQRAMAKLLQGLHKPHSASDPSHTLHPYSAFIAFSAHESCGSL